MKWSNNWTVYGPIIKILKCDTPWNKLIIKAFQIIDYSGIEIALNKIGDR